MVNRGRLLTLTVDGQSVDVWTTARTVEDALAGTRSRPDDYALSADRSRAIPLDGFEVEAMTKHTVTVVRANGTTSTTFSVTSMTVRSLLQSQGIVLAPNQVVRPALDSMIVGDTPADHQHAADRDRDRRHPPRVPGDHDATTVGEVLTQAGITLVAATPSPFRWTAPPRTASRSW